jgi:hypothetical protein
MNAQRPVPGSEQALHFLDADDIYGENRNVEGDLIVSIP